MAFPRALLSAASAFRDDSKIHGGIRNAGNAATRYHSGERGGTLEVADVQTIRPVFLSGTKRFACESLCAVEGPLGAPRMPDNCDLPAASMYKKEAIC